MDKNKMDFFETYFHDVKKALPAENEVVICTNVSEIGSYGIPTTFAYYDHEKEEWFDKGYEDTKDESLLDFRDINNNLNYGSGKVTYWMYRCDLAEFFAILYQNYQKEMKEKKVENEQK